MNPDGSGEQYLGLGSHPTWSPDSSQIAFEVPGDALPDNELWVMKADGSDRHLIALDGADPTWSPDGHTILFVTQDEPPQLVGNPPVIQLGTFGLSLVNDDGTGRRLLTSEPDPCTSFVLLPGRPCIELDPQWSPDGAHIAFSHDDEYGDTSASDIVVINADGTGYREITGTAFRSGGSPSWDPTGTSLAFGGGFRIWTVRLDGSGLTLLPAPRPGDNFDPSWSPDGSKILFRSYRFHSSDSELYVMNVDGSDPVVVTNTPEVVEDNPDWGARPFLFRGFFPPLANAPATNVVNAGRAIPVKFSVSGNGELAILAAGSPASQPIDCRTRGALGPAEPTATSGHSALNYDPESGTRKYVWKTRSGWAGTCRRLLLGLSDGTSHVAYFRFR